MDRAVGGPGGGAGGPGLRLGGCRMPVGRSRLRGVLRRIAPEKEVAEETGLEPASPKAAVFKTAALPIMLLLRGGVL